MFEDQLEDLVEMYQKQGMTASLEVLFTMYPGINMTDIFMELGQEREEGICVFIPKDLSVCLSICLSVCLTFTLIVCFTRSVVYHVPWHQYDGYFYGVGTRKRRRYISLNQTTSLSV